METRNFSALNNSLILYKELPVLPNSIGSGIIAGERNRVYKIEKEISLPEILFITSYPPRECGIATYSQDLITALNNKFSKSFLIKVCAIDSENINHNYKKEVKYTIEDGRPDAYTKLAEIINSNHLISIVLIQHEFGLFHKQEWDFSNFLTALTKPVVMVFHTVLPYPAELLKLKVQKIVDSCAAIVVMTKNSEGILVTDYEIESSKITVIPHGTHLVPHLDKTFLKKKYNLEGRKVLSTFGLLSGGKSIETTLQALPEIIKTNNDVIFLIIGKTHPGVTIAEGEIYRNMLQAKVNELKLQDHVRFINQYLPLPELLEYLQLTDIYLFTSKDRNQAVSGTFSYAISCGCPVISTPIPHAREVLGNDAGIIIDFENVKQLQNAINRLLNDEELKENLSSNGLHRIVSTSWENTAVAHAILFDRISENKISLHYSRPGINLNHIKRLTTDFGMIQFSKINRPDILSGYTLDDNARAMIAMCMHYELTGNKADLIYITTYLDFIKYCQQPEGNFLNYVDSTKIFTNQNNETNLDDANGRAIWALGFLISKNRLLPETLVSVAKIILQLTLPLINSMHSTRAMGFAIKGLYYSNRNKKSPEVSLLIKTLANRLVQMYRHESSLGWEWYESYLTYANSILPEALLCAYIETGEETYREIAWSSFDFLLSIIFQNGKIKVVSNDGWQMKGMASIKFGEQPIDVAYTILALSRFYNVFKEKEYINKMETAFNWFLGKNHLNHIVYNPCTGGCYDGLEEHHVNLNQGAESTVSYLLSRLAIEKNTIEKKVNTSFISKQKLFIH